MVFYFAIVLFIGFVIINGAFSGSKSSMDSKLDYYHSAIDTYTIVDSIEKKKEKGIWRFFRPQSELVKEEQSLKYHTEP